MYALVASSKDLYAIGAFTNAGGLPTADRIARWNGSAWSSLGSDGAGDGALKDRAYAAFVSGGNVYVGGRFLDVAGLAEADHVARWNGSAWSALGSNGAGDGSFNSDTQALAIANNALVVGGIFTNVNGVPTADYIASLGLGGAALRPDGRIRKGTGAYVGNNIYNTTGVGQAKTGAKARGYTIRFGISVQNDSTTGADSFRLIATGTASAMYAVTYWRGTTDITAAVVAGTYTTPSLAPGAKYLITVKVKVKSSATKGSSTTRLVTITSVGDGSKQDAVNFAARRL